MAFAKRVDANQTALIELFRAAGASVYVISEPVDLLVGYMGQTCAVEIKNPNRQGKKIKTRQQVEFFEEFKGMSAIVKTDGDCLELLQRMREAAK